MSSCTATELVVELEDKRLRFRNLPEIHAEIRAADRTSARLHTASGDIRARGTLGETKTHAASGDVEVDRVEGRLDAHSASGDVEVESVGGDASIHTASGDVDIRRSDAAVKVQSASGDVDLGDAGGGPIRSSRRRVMSASPSGRAPPRGRRSHGQRRGKPDIPLDGSAGEDADAPLVEIQVNGVSGDVRIERATSEVGALESQCKVKEPAGISTYP